MQLEHNDRRFTQLCDQITTMVTILDLWVLVTVDSPAGQLRPCLSVVPAAVKSEWAVVIPAGLVEHAAEVAAPLGALLAVLAEWVQVAGASERQRMCRHAVSVLDTASFVSVRD